MATDYCTIPELERYLSEIGVAHFADHDDNVLGDPSVVQDCIEEATDEINMAVLRRGYYLLTDLAGNRLLKAYCVVIASRFLCLRRGNMPPESLEMEFQRIMSRPDGVLERLATGKDFLPEVPRRVGAPTFSNLTVDRRRRREKIRVTQQNSTGMPTSLEQDVSSEVLDG